MLKPPSKTDLGIIGVFIVVALAVNWKLVADGFLFAAYDIGWHLLWVQEFSSELAGGVIYPRWLDNANYGWGSATFVFYPPLVYYWASLLKAVLQLNAGDISTIIFCLGVFFCATNFYLFARQHWNRVAATVGAIAYATAPYLTFDIYFRGALAETVALAWLPLLFLFTDKSSRDRRWQIALIGSFALLALTHLPTFLLGSIFWLPYVALRALTPLRAGDSPPDSAPVEAKIATAAMSKKDKKKAAKAKKDAQFAPLAKKQEKRDDTSIADLLPRESVMFFLRMLGCAALGAGLAAVYLIPAMAQQHFVNINALKEMAGGWQDHMLNSPRVLNFVVLPDVIMRTAIATALLAVLALIFQKGDLPSRLKDKEVGFWLLLSAALMFGMTSASSFIWQNIKPLQMLQFPWRLLSLLSFAMAAVCALAVHRLIESRLSKNQIRILCGVMVACLLLTNIMFDQIMTKFRAGIRNVTPTLEDGTDLAVITSRMQQLPRLLDNLGPYPDVEEYRPLIQKEHTTAAVPAPHAGSAQYQIMTGTKAKAEVKNWTAGRRELHVSGDSQTTVRLRTYWYPAWKGYIDGQPAPIKQSEEGAIEFTCPQGEHDVELRYEMLNDEKIAAAVSAISMLLLLGLAGKELLKKRA